MLSGIFSRFVAAGRQGERTRRSRPGYSAWSLVVRMADE